MTFTYVQFSDFSNSQPSIKGELAGISDRRFVNRGFSDSLEQTRNAGELGETQRAMTLSEEYMGVLFILFSGTKPTAVRLMSIQGKTQEWLILSAKLKKAAIN